LLRRTQHHQQRQPNLTATAASASQIKPDVDRFDRQRLGVTGLPGRAFARGAAPARNFAQNRHADWPPPFSDVGLAASTVLFLPRARPTDARQQPERLLRPQAQPPALLLRRTSPRPTAPRKLEPQTAASASQINPGVDRLDRNNVGRHWLTASSAARGRQACSNFAQIATPTGHDLQRHWPDCRLHILFLYRVAAPPDAANNLSAYSGTG